MPVTTNMRREKMIPPLKLSLKLDVAFLPLPELREEDPPGLLKEKALSPLKPFGWKMRLNP